MRRAPRRAHWRGRGSHSPTYCNKRILKIYEGSRGDQHRNSLILNFTTLLTWDATASTKLHTFTHPRTCLHRRPARLMRRASARDPLRHSRRRATGLRVRPASFLRSRRRCHGAVCVRPLRFAWQARPQSTPRARHPKRPPHRRSPPPRWRVARAVGKRKAHLFVLKTSILSALLGRELKHVPRLVFAAGYAHRHSTRQRRHINPRVRQRRVPHAARGACVQRQRVRHALVAPLAQQPPLRLIGDVHAALHGRSAPTAALRCDRNGSAQPGLARPSSEPPAVMAATKV